MPGNAQSRIEKIVSKILLIESRNSICKVEIQDILEYNIFDEKM